MKILQMKIVGIIISATLLIGIMIIVSERNRLICAINSIFYTRLIQSGEASFPINNSEEYIVNIVLDGKEKRFLVDTAASFSIVHARHTGNKEPTWLSLNATDINNNRKELNTFAFNRLEIGEIVFERPQFGGVDELPYEDIDGIIGQNILTKCILVIDNTNQLLKFSTIGVNNSFEQDENYKEIPLNGDVFNIFVNGNMQEARIDTGVFLSGANFKTLGLYDKFQQKNIVIHGLFGSPEYIEISILENVLLGETRINRIVAMDIPRQWVLIGRELISRFNMILDYGNGRMFIKKISEINLPSIFELNIGFNKEFFIEDLWEKSPLFNIGLRRGDIILRINGMSMEKFNNQFEFIDFFVDDFIRSIEIAFQDENKIFQF